VNKLRVEGKTFKLIGEFLNVSPSRAREIYIKSKKKERYRAVIKDFLNGLSIELIASNHYYPVSTIKSLINTFNIKDNYSRLIQDFSNGKSVEYLARKNGYPICKVHCVIKKFNHISENKGNH